MLGALADEELVIADDEAGGHLLHRATSWLGEETSSAERSGSTQLVKVKAKAASPGCVQMSSSVCVPKSWLSTTRYMRAFFTSRKLLAPVTRTSSVALAAVSGCPSWRISMAMGSPVVEAITRFTPAAEYFSAIFPGAVSSAANSRVEAQRPSR